MKFKKWIILIGISLLCLIMTIVLYKKALQGYAILTFTGFGIFLFAGVITRVRYGDPNNAYNSSVRSVLNTFDSIMVRSSSVPNLENRNIVVLMTIDDLIDAQLEVRKPICYLKQVDSCSFVLLDDKEAYVYIMKAKEDIVSPVEIAIRELEIKSKHNDSIDSEILRDIEKTTVVKLSNQKSYKISPIRKEKKEEEKTKEEKVEEVEKEEKKKEVKEEVKEKKEKVEVEKEEKKTTSKKQVEKVEKKEKKEKEEKIEKTDKKEKDVPLGKGRFVLHSFDN